MSLSHYFNKFQFNTQEGADLDELRLRFSDYPEHLQFDLSTHKANREELETPDHYNYFKFCKLVAHTYIDELQVGSERDYHTWQYSLTQNRKKNDYISHQYVQMQIEFSPLTMKITKSSNSLSKFLISLCGIVGGVFVIFGMLNAIV